jgi:hypothetical protein
MQRLGHGGPETQGERMTGKIRPERAFTAFHAERPETGR